MDSENGRRSVTRTRVCATLTSEICRAYVRFVDFFVLARAFFAAVFICALWPAVLSAAV